MACPLAKLCWQRGFSCRTIEISRHLLKEGPFDMALQAVDHMLDQGAHIPNRTFYHLLQRCIVKEDLATGLEIHRRIMRSRYGSNSFLATHLIRLFTVCGILIEANQAFEKLRKPSVFAWSAIISANAKLGQDEEAIKLFGRMKRSNVRSDGHLFVAVLKACSTLEQGKLVHADLFESGFESNVFVGSSLIDMYCNCSSLHDARKTFDRLPKHDLVTWNAMIEGYVKHQHGHKALGIFCVMQIQGWEPDRVTFISILKCCSATSALDQGVLIHCLITEMGFELDAHIGNTLIDMYGKCGHLQDAHSVFNKLLRPDVVIWSAMIAGYAQYGHSHIVFQLYNQMKQECVKPNEVTFIGIIKACSNMGAVEEGMLIHSHAIFDGFESDVVVASTLVDMYAKHGSLEDARNVFDRSSEQNVVMWSVMIAGYVHVEDNQEAINLFQQMLNEDVGPDSITYTSIIKACASMVSLCSRGELIHYHIVKSGYERDMFIGSALVQMYMICRDLKGACKVFNMLPKRDLVAWSALIAGLVQHGDYESALQYSQEMHQDGLRPNAVIFLCLLSACNHMGLLYEGCWIFKSMIEDHNISPTIDHYDCMVDILGRAGCLEEAEALIKTAPFGCNIIGWVALLTHCQTHCDVKLGLQCFESVVDMDCKTSAVYVLMSNLYAHAGMQEDAGRVEDFRRDTNVWKKPGEAIIEVGSEVFTFHEGERCHSQMMTLVQSLR